MLTHTDSYLNGGVWETGPNKDGRLLRLDWTEPNRLHLVVVEDGRIIDHTTLYNKAIRDFAQLLRTLAGILDGTPAKTKGSLKLAGIHVSEVTLTIFVENKQVDLGTVEMGEIANLLLPPHAKEVS